MDSYENSFEKEVRLLHDKITEIENKYFFFKEYKALTCILEKAGITEMEVSAEEIENCKTIYTFENRKDKMILRKMEEINE